MEDEDEGREEGGSMWRTLPVITFQKFDDLTGGARLLTGCLQSLTHFHA